MFLNYIKIAFRNLLKNKVYSFINIIGLAAGMAVTIMIGLWIADELTYNNYFENKAQIAQVFESATYNKKTVTGSAIPRPLEFTLREEHADNFKYISMASWQSPRYLQYGEKNLYEEGMFMQEDAPHMLDLKIVKGKKSGLQDKNSIMLSEMIATKLFVNQDPIGKIIKVNNKDPMKVTAVYKDIPLNNAFNEVQFFMPWTYYTTTQKWLENAKTQWGNNSFQLFVQIHENTTMDAVTTKIKDVKLKAAKDEVEFNPQLFLHPMKDWHLHSEFENGVQSGGRIENVWLFGIIGLFVLLLACINFINLSTARSEKRATEVGIRKSIGSKRGQLVFQFLSESFLVVVLSFVMAMAIVLLFLKGFNELAAKEIVFPWTNPSFWAISLAFITITALLSGAYPALYLSSFNPVTVLKGTFKAGKYTSLPRKTLVVTQFTVSIALIIGTLVVINQITHSKDRPVGYNRDGLIQIPTMSPVFMGKADIMRDQFIASGAVTQMATSSAPPTDVWSNRGGYTWDGKSPDLQEVFTWRDVSYEFVQTMGAKVIEGRGFSREFATDTNAILLNKKAVDYMGLTNPVGKNIRYENPDNTDKPMKIIGVIEDIITQSPYEPIKPAIYAFDYEGNIAFYLLRLDPNKSVSSSLGTIETIFKKNFPSIPFDYDFVDQEYAKKFRSEERVASLARVFTLLAILISCLGLFGLASFVAEQRTKEIGVRKVLGATVSNLWVLLSKDFIKLVLIALLIAVPIAYFAMNSWLQKFNYRTTVSWDVFLIAGCGALIITIITVSVQAIRAATANPVNSLRTE